MCVSQYNDKLSNNTSKMFVFYENTEYIVNKIDAVRQNIFLMWWTLPPHSKNNEKFKNVHPHYTPYGK